MSASRGISSSDDEGLDEVNELDELEPELEEEDDDDDEDSDELVVVDVDRSLEFVVDEAADEDQSRRRAEPSSLNGVPAYGCSTTGSSCSGLSRRARARNTLR
jgi:hypothetical protein